MTDQEFIEQIADALEVEPNDISVDTKLETIAEYDSMAKLSVIVLLDEEFDKKLSGEDMGKFETIGDIMSFARS